MIYPTYSNPPLLVFRFAYSVILGLKRSFHKDSQYFVSKIQPPIQVLGSEFIPKFGPALITMNHYYRAGFRAWWLALGINSIITGEIHWIMAAAWTYPNQFLGEIRSKITQTLFRRIANVYSITTMPPMPPRPEETMARAIAVRQVLGFIRKSSQSGRPPIIGIAPEGGDNLGGTLAMPAAGVGRFIYHLNHTGLIIHPVGAFEQDGKYTIHFGDPYQLSIPADLTADERDQRVRAIVMQRIARLLPGYLRGEF
jgi:hypothetical protein